MLEKTIMESVFELLEKKKTITTLEAKIHTRNKFPSMKVYQSDVSDVMEEMALCNLLKFEDNGTYRIYSLKEDEVYLNRSNLIDVILQNPGTFMTVSWIKKSGERRECNIQTKSKPIDSFGYIDCRTNKKEFKKIDTRTIDSVKVNGIIYKLK